jgi:hypothetical protein
VTTTGKLGWAWTWTSTHRTPSTCMAGESLFVIQCVCALHSKGK